MPNIATRPQRRISCRLHHEAVVIDLSADDDQPEILFLTVEEAKMLASDLAVELVCAGECPPPKIVVADVILTTDEAWELVDAIGDVLGLNDVDNADDRMAVPWQKEGF